MKPCTAATYSLLYEGGKYAERYWCPESSNAPVTSPELIRGIEQIEAMVRDSNMTFFFVGDSVMEQQLRAMACALRVEGSHIPWWSAWQWRCYNNSHTTNRTRAPLCFCNAGERRGGGRTGSSRRVFDDALVSFQLRGLLRREALRPGDAVVMSEGVHFRQRPLDGAELSRIERIATLDHEAFENASRLGVHVFWRETLAQHFSTPDGLFPRVFNSTADARAVESCSAPVREPTAVLARNTAVTGLLQSKLRHRLHVLPAFVQSLEAGVMDHYGTCAMHNKTSASGAVCSLPGGSIQRAGIDCTHWCEQSGILWRLNAALGAKLAPLVARG